MGRVLGQGAAVIGHVLGVSRVHSAKGQAMPAYDPRLGPCSSMSKQKWR